VNMAEGRYWSTDLQRWVYPGEVQLPPPRVVHHAETQQELCYYTPEDVRDLVLTERERCAAICDALESAEEDGWSAAGSYCAGAVRAGGVST
jgi:hypothetical protein